MRYAFVIDQNRCIGCHACTVACKEEHSVPLGVNRTWVKYIEKGEFPTTSRHFAVLRCNHCDEAPCVEICPTVSLYRRDDGIVDFDASRCIGCKSCMQACPYDALYIDPASHTAAKCNFCAHRVEQRLQPACEIVCPVQAIISGDVDDPSSRVSRIVATAKVAARKPHKGTEPKLFYVGVDDDVLQPTRLRGRTAHLWAETADLAPTKHSTRAPGDPREVYDVAHTRPWGWMIAAYLWTKSVAAGVVMLAILFFGSHGDDAPALFNIVTPAVALVFTGLTMSLLVADLKRPERFLFIFTKSNPRSWLVIGGYMLMAFGLLCVAWLVTGVSLGAVPPFIRGIGGITAIAAACYTAFLFAQAKGRDLWQSPLFVWHLLVQALVAGAATWMLIGISVDATPTLVVAVAKVLAMALCATAAILIAEVALVPVSEDVRVAHDVLVKGELALRFWILVLGIGIAVPLLALFGSSARANPSDALLTIAAVLALVGLWGSEDAWVRAGQSTPLS